MGKLNKKQTKLRNKAKGSKPMEWSDYALGRMEKRQISKSMVMKAIRIGSVERNCTLYLTEHNRISDIFDVTEQMSQEIAGLRVIITKKSSDQQVLVNAYWTRGTKNYNRYDNGRFDRG